MDREALVAIMVWRLIALMMKVSASWASMMGALTSRMGSSSKKMLPSGRARIAPVKRKPSR
jgi:hypothetical protein